jgi:hypothetical protein
MYKKFSSELTRTKGALEHLKRKREDNIKMKHIHVMIGCELESFILGQETLVCFSFHIILRN